LVFVVACAEPFGSSKQQVVTRRTNGRNLKPIVDKLFTFQPSLDHTLKEGTNVTCRRINDLPKTFTFLELSFAKTNSQMKTSQRLVYKHFAAIEIACESTFNSFPF